MKETLITFETAKLAKEKGFDKPCNDGYYETMEYELDCGRGDIIQFPYIAPRTLSQPVYSVRRENVFIAQAPSQPLLQKWLREVHNHHIGVEPETTNPETDYISEIIMLPRRFLTYRGKTYEEALEKALHAALNLIK